MVVRIEPGDVDGYFPDSQPSEMLNMLAHIVAKMLNSGGHRSGEGQSKIQMEDRNLPVQFTVCFWTRVEVTASADSQNSSCVRPYMCRLVGSLSCNLSDHC